MQAAETAQRMHAVAMTLVSRIKRTPAAVMVGVCKLKKFRNYELRQRMLALILSVPPVLAASILQR